jgi:hypothetical protein
LAACTVRICTAPSTTSTSPGVSPRSLLLSRGEIGQKCRERASLGLLCEPGGNVADRVQVRPGQAGCRAVTDRDLHIQTVGRGDICDQVGQRLVQPLAQRPQFVPAQHQPPVALCREWTGLRARDRRGLRRAPRRQGAHRRGQAPRRGWLGRPGLAGPAWAGPAWAGPAWAVPVSAPPWRDQASVRARRYRATTSRGPIRHLAPVSRRSREGTRGRVGEHLKCAHHVADLRGCRAGRRGRPPRPAVRVGATPAPGANL